MATFHSRIGVTGNFPSQLLCTGVSGMEIHSRALGSAFLFKFYVYECFACTRVFAPLVCLVPVEDTSRITWTWSYRWSQITHVGAGKLNLRNLEEYHMLSATEQSLQPLEFVELKNVLNLIELSTSNKTGGCLYSAPHTRPWPLECAQLQRDCSAPVLLWLH